MNRITSTPNTAQAEDPLRFPRLIRTCLARRRSPTPPEPKCVQVRPRIKLYTLTGRVACCSPSIAMSWVREIASDALAGDRDASRALPLAVEHYLRARQAQLR